MFNDYLAALTLKIRRTEDLVAAIGKVLDDDAEALAFEVVQRLLRAGLLREQAGALVIRYQLYERYFRAWLR